MTLLDVLDKHKVNHDGHKCCCPFHHERNPSAIMNSNASIYCFVCNCLYSRQKIEQLFGEKIDTFESRFIKENKERYPLFIL